jgi:hypothetical protein
MNEPDMQTATPIGTNQAIADLKFANAFKQQNESIRMTYWEKINYKKELKKKKTEQLMKHQ